MNNLSVVLQTIFVLLSALVSLHLSGKSILILRKFQEFLHGKPGCAPVEGVGNVTLHYFNARGNAEGIRLMLQEARIPYKEVLFAKETWPQHKEKGIQSGLFTFGQVPAIETTSGIRMVQSQTIMHYLGRATGMQCDCDHLHLCDMLSRGVVDARNKYTLMVYDRQFSLADRNNYLKNVLPMWLTHFERIAPQLTKQDRAFFYSDRLTWVDFVMFDYLEMNIEFSKYNFGPNALPLKVDLLEDFPKLNNFYHHIANRPNIYKYLTNKRRTPFKVPNVPVDSKLM